jgi:putative ABC transport system permease protein
MNLLRRVLLRLVSSFRSSRAETDLAREIAAHLQILEDRFQAEGMTAEDARFAARRAFGGVEQVKERQRDARSFRWLTGWSMDLRLGARMLVKYPGLTIVGGLAIAFAIGLGAAAFEAMMQLVAPAIPLEDGDRIVGIRNWDVEARRVEQRSSHDFFVWRAELDGVDDIGAFRTAERNLIVDGRAGAPVEVAEISASAFRIARVAPLLGRALVETDESPGAPLVIVIGYDIWEARFSWDPSVVGRTLRLGASPATVVGVMPEGFAFPVSHSLWTPLGLDVAGHGRREGPEIRVFGRLAPGMSRGEAQAALTAIGLRAAAESPVTHGQLRPELLPYARSIMDVSEIIMGSLAANVGVVLFLALVCANVGALVFARAMTRRNEILVRSALGASRARIMMQLFAEALVLGGVAALAGLAAAQFVLAWWMSVSAAEAGGRLPFWLHGSLSSTTVLYAAVLTALGAVIAGAWPALKVTGRRLEGQLRQIAAGDGDAGFGSAWTAVLVAQVAVTAAFPAAAFFARQYVVGIQSFDVGFPAEQFLSARLDVDREAVAGFRTTYDELARRLTAEGGISGVTFADRLPRTSHPERRIEVADDGGGTSEAAGEQRVSQARVDPSYFDVLGVQVVAGRTFTSGDLRPGPRAVVVNQSFAERVLGSRNAVGRHVRYARRSDADASPWFEIVGVVPDLGTIHDDPRNGAGIYHPVAPGEVFPLHIALHVRGDPEALTSRLRAIALEVDPTLRLDEVLPLDAVGSTMWMELDFLWRLLVLVSAIALLLSLAGIYAVMSLTVSRRRREIGIRLALGADRRHVIVAIFSRALAQVGVGILAGGILVIALTRAVAALSVREIVFVTGYMALMAMVCMLACIVPTRRALDVEPTETLRAEA